MKKTKIVIPNAGEGSSPDRFIKIHLLRLGMTAIIILLSACSSSGGGSYQSYLLKRHVPLSTPEAIHHCHGYGCRKVSEVNITEKDWQKIANLFYKKSKSAHQEREKIAKAIGLFEQAIGPLDGTDKDIRGTFRKTGDGQLDCVDESTNTTTYISLLQTRGLLKFHTLNAPTMRLPIIHAGRWPHQTAVITENQSGISFAVDSWFHDNGAPAEIIELEKWKEGWKPRSVHDLL